tara:strand:+ start:10006 stop:11925 length:1920 start_codon:yes stop_codon:yes gene_type:complete
MDHDTLAAWVQKSVQKLQHRGPDNQGIWVDDKSRIALGHRRLAVMDPSQGGHQPMISQDNRLVISYNGEVYNFKELRRDLSASGITFKGHSDTEVLIAGINTWGLFDTLRRVNGMFAFALWDKHTKQLQLVRDRFGQKPLYYGWSGNNLVFGSELSALIQFPGFEQNIDTNSLQLLLQHNNIPAPYTIYENCWKLMPGTVLTVCTQDLKYRKLRAPEVFWSAVEAATQGLAAPLRVPADEAIDQLKTELLEAVSRCMVSDVPIGAFLSGGVDSSLVAALMQQDSEIPIKTFSIGFTDQKYNEAIDAKNIANQLGTSHTELYLTANEAQSIIPELPKIYDEPFADSSQLPTHLVSKLARQQVTVSLSGDGGDELFGGYNRYIWSQRLGKLVAGYPHWFRSCLSRGLHGPSPEQWDKMYSVVTKYSTSKRPISQFGDKLYKLGNMINATDCKEMYWRLVSQWEDPSSAVIGGGTILHPARKYYRWPQVDDLVQQIMLLDTIFYLPNDILVKLDRASMAVGLETRVPFLDHKLFEFAWRLPLDLKVKNGCGKWILKEVLSSYLPRPLFERPKMGFGIPLADWLRKDLREWAEELLSLKNLQDTGYFDPKMVQTVWKEHLSGAHNHQYQLWPVLMFQAWLEAK